MAKRPSRFLGCRVVARCGKRRARPGRKGGPCIGWCGVVECDGRKVAETGIQRSKAAALSAATKLRRGRGRVPAAPAPTRQVCKRWKRISLWHWKTGRPFTKRQCASWGWE